MQSTVAIVLAAGSGTRMHSARPKMLHEVLGWPLVVYPVHAALGAGAEAVVVVVSAAAEPLVAAVRRHTDAAGAPVAFAVQDPPRGTADAVRAAAQAAAGHARVLIVNGDAVALRPETIGALAQVFEASGGRLAITTAELDPAVPYGRIVRDAAGNPSRIVEFRDATPAERALREMNVGLYLAEAGFLFEALGHIDAGNSQGEFYLTDLVARAAAAGPVGVHRLDDVGEALGVNDRRDLAHVSRTLSARFLARWQAQVTFEHPDVTTVGPEVSFAGDSTVAPGVTVLGRTTVGRGCLLGPGAVLVDATLEDHVTVGPHAVILGARVFAGFDVPALTVVSAPERGRP